MLGSQDCVPCQGRGAQGTVPIFIFLQKTSKELSWDRSKRWLLCPNVGSGEDLGLTGVNPPTCLHPTPHTHSGAAGTHCVLGQCYVRTISSNPHSPTWHRPSSSHFTDVKTESQGDKDSPAGKQDASGICKDLAWFQPHSADDHK